MSTLAAESKPNVILITLDGVRFQEINDGIRFPRKAGEPRGRELLPKLKARVNRGEAFHFGMWISNWAGLSQPGYRSILSGEFEDRCKENTCANIDRKTIFDDLYDQGLKRPGELAAFSSWDVIGKTIESQPGRIVRNISLQDYEEEGLTPSEQATINDINAKMKTDLPKWHGSRYDKYTYELSKFFIQKHLPRFFYMQFVDTDEWAHAKSYKGYVRGIRDFDEQLEGLIQMLDQMGEYGENTSIVITTDHGRGRGLFWTKHSREFLSADRVWAFVIPSKHLLKTKRVRERWQFVRSHIDIRPTVETLLGLTPKHGKKNRGKSLIKF